MKLKLSNKFIYFLSSIVFSLGLLIAWQWISYSESKDIAFLENKFNQSSIQANITITSALKRELERLNSLGAVFKLSQNISKQDFERFAGVLLANNNIQTLEWIAVVPNNQRLHFETEMADLLSRDGFSIKAKRLGQLRDVEQHNPSYAVVKYIYPVEENDKEIGLDVYSNPVQKQAMLQAAKNESVIALSSHYVESNKNNFNTIVYQPVYDVQNTLKGYVALRFNLNRFIESFRDNFFIEKNLGISFFDKESSSVPFAMLEPEYDMSEGFYRKKVYLVPFANRSWEMHIEANLKDIDDSNIFDYNSLQTSWIEGGVFSFYVSLLVFLLLRFWMKIKEREAILASQQQHYHDIINQSSEAYYLLRCDGSILDVNDESCKVLGYSRDELLRMSISQIDCKYSAEEIADICSGIQVGKKLLFQTIHKDKNGQKIDVEISANKFKMKDEYVTIAFVRNITEQIINRDLSLSNEQLQKKINRATRDLNDQKQAFETIFEKSADGIFISEGRHVVDCNQATVKVFGYKSKEQLLSLPNSVFAPKFQPDGEPSHRKGFRMLQICLEKGSHRYEWVNKRANGEEFWTDIVLTRLEFFGRTVIHIAFRDISKPKQLESEMKLAREQAIAANKAKSDFLAKMTHDIRTPLHGVLSYSQLGESRYLNASQEQLKRYFKNINTSAQRLMSLLNNVLDSEKIESGMMHFNFKYQSIKPVILACVNEQLPLIKEKNIELLLQEFDYMAIFDESRIAQVISNLLSNAIRHTPQNQKIQIYVEPYDSESIVFSLQDSGEGIKPDEVELIFDKFIQSKNNAPNTGGSGLGLAISKEIISAHKGKIWSENWTVKNEAQGAVFRFTLPIHSVDGVKNANQ